MDKIKSRPIPETGVPCYWCGKKMFAGDTPQGADCTSCPICKSGCWYPIPYYYDEDKGEVVKDENYQGPNYNYCDQCNIVFGLGCTHGVNGCTDDIYHGRLVYSYEYGGEKHDGMPVFESVKHCRKVLPNMKLNWFCTCNNNQYDCKKASYPKEVEHNCKNYEKK